MNNFKTRKNLSGSDAAFTRLLKRFIEKALEAEMEVNLDEAERSQENKRNGKRKKTIKNDFKYLS